MSIPKGLTREHIERALAELEAGISHPFGRPTRYELIFNGNSYPPKAVIGLAIQHQTGSLPLPREFSGGEGSGQANHALRRLGFEVRRIGPATFITSRRFVLPDSGDEIAETLWFNMWSRRLWPYQTLEAGDTLYWYESIASKKTITWKTEVAELDRFEYETKADARDHLLAAFHQDVSEDPYFIAAPDRGYCLAYRVSQAEHEVIPKPDNCRFPQEGWLRADDPRARKWLSRAAIEGESPTEAPVTAVGKALGARAFDPATAKDERERRQREVLLRRGQAKFRRELILAYESRCAITCCDAVAALEAAHIWP